MKATLEFNLPEEQSDFYDATNGWKYKAVLQDFDRYLKSMIGSSLPTEDQIELVDQIRQKMWEMVNDEGVEI